MSALDSIDSFGAASLDVLGRASELGSRPARTYVIDGAQLGDLLQGLETDHDAIEVAGRRRSTYRSVYFDTPELDCYFAHIHDRVPRYRVRTREYGTGNSCDVEVAVKDADGTVSGKRFDCDAGGERESVRRRRTEIDEALREAAIDPPERLEPTLVTELVRSTLVPRDGGGSVTIDSGVRLIHGAMTLNLEDDLALAECKGDPGRADEMLADMGVEPVALSKYRLGIATLSGVESGDTYPARVVGAFAQRPLHRDDEAAWVLTGQRSAELGVAMSPSPHSVLDDRS